MYNINKKLINKNHNKQNRSEHVSNIYAKMKTTNQKKNVKDELLIGFYNLLYFCPILC